MELVLIMAENQLVLGIITRLASAGKRVLSRWFQSRDEAGQVVIVLHVPATLLARRQCATGVLTLQRNVSALASLVFMNSNPSLEFHYSPYGSGVLMTGLDATFNRFS